MSKQNSTIYDPDGKRVKALQQIAVREKLHDQRGLPSVPRALDWLIAQDDKVTRDGVKGKANER